MSIRMCVPPEDEVHGLLHLEDVDFGAGVEGLLDDRLVGASRTPEGALERLVAAQAGVDLAEAVGAGEDGDEGVLELLDGLMPDGLLLDMEVLTDGVEELESVDPDADGGECGVRGVVSGSSLRAHRDVPPGLFTGSEGHKRTHLTSAACGSMLALFGTKLRYVRVTRIFDDFQVTSSNGCFGRLSIYRFGIPKFTHNPPPISIF